MVEVAATGGGGGGVVMGERFAESGVPRERRRNEGGEESGGWGDLPFLWQLPLLFNPHGRSPLSRAERSRGETRR